jgi:hypothetical protein
LAQYCAALLRVESVAEASCRTPNPITTKAVRAMLSATRLRKSKLISLKSGWKQATLYYDSTLMGFEFRSARRGFPRFFGIYFRLIDADDTSGNP